MLMHVLELLLVGGWGIKKKYLQHLSYISHRTSDHCWLSVWGFLVLVQLLFILRYIRLNQRDDDIHYQLYWVIWFH